MRLAIREQLALLILLASLIGLGVISIATWVSNHNFVLSVVESRLSLTASLKADQLSSNLDLMQTTSNLVSTRVIIQGALQRYDDSGDNSADNWSAAEADLAAVFGSTSSLGQSILLQSSIYARDASGPAGHSPVLKVTSNTAMAKNIKLPLLCPDGTHATLGMKASNCGGHSFGYPPILYPNLTYSSTQFEGSNNVAQATYKGITIGPGAREALLLGPWPVNPSLSLVSLTVPMINNTSAYDVLGWLTVVMDAKLIRQVLNSAEGLEQTGETLLIGPLANTNVFSRGVPFNRSEKDIPNNFLVRYITPLRHDDQGRHPNHVVGTDNPPFEVDRYPAIEQAYTQQTGNAGNAGALVRGRDEAGTQVAVGYAIPKSPLVDWLVVLEQSRKEVWQPINHLRNILLACLFGTVGFLAILAWPLAHFAVLPIRRLQDATARSIEPPSQSRSSFDSYLSDSDRDVDGAAVIVDSSGAVKENPHSRVARWRHKRQNDKELKQDRRRKSTFRIPSKVPNRKHFVEDELTDLTTTFNEMSDELMAQYSKLEERVRQRTAELELSKKAAEAANESKTLFIANISHELKTPLNGILGMAAVCMQEDDPDRVKRSLGVIYKSGDLLLNLLTDLLTFSKNQVGQQLSLDEKEFYMRDISTQIESSFEKQARESSIDLHVTWEGGPAHINDGELGTHGPHGTGRLKDMILYGDVQRILQVLINLVSNALKFTPSGGSVVLKIRCLPELATMSRKTSRTSRQHGSDASLVQGMPGRIATANAINARDRPNARATSYDRTASPPPGMYLQFEFEVLDTGPGIPEHLQAQIFEPFMQGDLGLSKKYGGTGLGLSICSQLAGLMHGSIDVHSVPGQGSTFTMRIPLRHLKTRVDSSASSSIELVRDGSLPRGVAIEDGEKIPAIHSRLAGEELTDDRKSSKGLGSPPKVTADPQPRLIGLSQPFFVTSDPLETAETQPAAMKKMAAEANRMGHKVRVLVAEDNKVNQEVVLRMLKLEDVYDVTVAKDGQEALDFVKESMAAPSPGGTKDCQAFDLILMDVQMPNVDGLQSTRLIRELGYRAPIVALTAFSEDSNIQDCMDSGMDYFL